MKVDSLKAAIVTATSRPKFKGDTLEYNTEHIFMQPNAVIEELLRRLPGLQIDPDGTISYNGEKIQHLLVDGEDIFGSNPTMVTRNFDASKIARVQILDRKSDQAIFTGVDDGTRTKVLNLVLKESAKDEYSGKVEAGGDTKGYYGSTGALAAFRNKEQLTVLGFASNTGGLGFSTSASAGAGFTSISFPSGNPDALLANAGTGIPRFEAGALHYANSWNDLGDHLNANYQFCHYYTHPITNILSLQTLTNSTYSQDEQSQSIDQQDQHWGYATYDLTPNKVSALKLSFSESNLQSQNQYEAITKSSFSDTLANASQRTIADRVAQNIITGSISWNTKLGPNPERIFSVYSSVSNQNSSTDGYIYSLDRYYQGSGDLLNVDTVDQRKLISDHTFSPGGGFSYTEPLWKGAILGLSYGLTNISDHPLQATFNRGDGKYQELVDSLSSYLQTDALTQRATVNIQGNSRHLNYIIGNDWIDFSYRQKNLLGDSTVHVHYFNWAPRLRLNYSFSPSMNIQFNYNVTTQKPTMVQLQPIINNSDPLHITLGNSGLRPGVNQNFTLDFHRLNSWMLNSRLNMTLMSNGISTKTITDSLGRQISLPVNVNGGLNSAIYFSLMRKVMGIDVGFHASGSFLRTVNFVNADLSRNDSYTGGGGLNLNKYAKDKYNLQLVINFTYFNQVSSINSTAPIHYWSQNHLGSVTIYLPQKYEFNSNVSYTWQEKTSAFSTNTSVVLWNSYISRNFLKDKLVVKAQINNILNQNSGITRTNMNNINTQNSTNILGRYWMLSVIYHFDKKFKKT